MSSDAPILTPLNLVTDIALASDFEKKHTPHITFERDDDEISVSVSVGRTVPHPNQPDHFIQWIELYAGDASLARVDLAPVASRPFVTFTLSLPVGTTVRAVEHCNLHGLWASEVVV